VASMRSHPWMWLLHDGPGQDVPDASGGTVRWISSRLVPLGWARDPGGVRLACWLSRTWVGGLGFRPATGD